MKGKSYTTEVPVENITERPAPLEQNVRRFVTSLVRTGLALAALPVNVLPAESRGHVKAAGRNLQAAGRELTYGAVSLLRFAADNLEEMAQGSNKEPRPQASSQA